MKSRLWATLVRAFQRRNHHKIAMSLGTFFFVAGLFGLYAISRGWPSSFAGTFIALVLACCFFGAVLQDETLRPKPQYERF